MSCLLYLVILTTFPLLLDSKLFIILSLTKALNFPGSMWPYYQQCQLSHAFSSCFRRLVLQMVLGIVQISISSKIFLQWASKIDTSLLNSAQSYFFPSASCNKKRCLNRSWEKNRGRSRGRSRGPSRNRSHFLTTFTRFATNLRNPICLVLYPRIRTPRIPHRSCSRRP